MKIKIYLLLSALFLNACAGSPTEPVETVKPVEPEALQEEDEEQNQSEYWVSNPTSGAEIYVKTYTPKNSSITSNTELPALVLVPGGGADSSFFENVKKDAQTLADLGFFVVTFDPDGRGKSEGAEDYNGFTQQDGLKAVIDSIEADSIGLITFSYGITMGAGVLARYPNLPVEFLIDWEGPASRDNTGGCDGLGTGHLQEIADCDNEDFWREREAVTFIEDIRIPYLRLQSEKDHTLPHYNHTLAMIEAALAGDSPWVRLNDGAVNETYTEQALKTVLMPEPIERDLMELIGKYSEALFAF